METKEPNHWKDSPSKFFSLGCPSAATPLLAARGGGDTSGLLSCCYPENPLLPTIAPYSYFCLLLFFFLFYSSFYYLCHLCCPLLHHIRYFRAPISEEGCQVQAPRMRHGNSSWDLPPTHCGFPCFHRSLLCRAGTNPKKKLRLAGPGCPCDYVLP